MFKDTAVIGSGLMGCGIAQIFARRGLNVSIYAPIDAADLVMNRIESDLRLLLDNGLIRRAELRTALDQITVTDELDIAIQNKEFIVECVPENLELKQNVFAQLDQLCPSNTILATNTSAMSITEIVSKAKDKERMVGTHFWNPPYLIPLVEVIKAEHTSEKTMNDTIDFLKLMGKHPVRVNKDVPGFVANRLQHALWREAISIVERGIAGAETVDECIRFGPGLRLPVLAPMENADMVGTDLTLSIHTYLLKHLENSTEPSPLLIEKVENGELGFKSGKGFFDWTLASAEESKRKLIHYLIQTAKEPTEN